MKITIDIPEADGMGGGHVTVEQADRRYDFDVLFVTAPYTRLMSTARPIEMYDNNMAQVLLPAPAAMRFVARIDAEVTSPYTVTVAESE